MFHPCVIVCTEERRRNPVELNDLMKEKLFVQLRVGSVAQCMICEEKVIFIFISLCRFSVLDHILYIQHFVKFIHVVTIEDLSVIILIDNLSNLFGNFVLTTLGDVRELLLRQSSNDDGKQELLQMKLIHSAYHLYDFFFNNLKGLAFTKRSQLIWLSK
jgi:hypothetical protein